MLTCVCFCICTHTQQRSIQLRTKCTQESPHVSRDISLEGAWKGVALDTQPNQPLCPDGSVNDSLITVQPPPLYFRKIIM